MKKPGDVSLSLFRTRSAARRVKPEHVLAGFLMLCSPFVFSGSAGIALFASGDVTLKSGGAEKKLTRGASVSVGDTIITAASAKATIKYTNGTTVDITESSNYEILSYDPKASVGLKTALNQGSITQDSHSKAGKKSVVKTPVVALAVLGTKVLFKVAGDSTFLKVSEGKVCVDNLQTGAIQTPCLGPNQQLLSGTFDANRKFTPGEASKPNPGNAVVSTAVNVNETVLTTTTTTTVNAVAPAVQQLSTIAEIVIIGTALR